MNQALAWFLKKVQKIDPERPDVEEKLSYMLRWAEKQQSGPARATPPPAPARDPDSGIIEGDLEVAEPATTPAPTPPESQPEVKGTWAELFRELPREAILQATKEMRLRTFEPGDIIVAEGEPGGSLYVVTSGELRAFVRNGTGRMVPVRKIAGGSFFGEISLLSGGKRTATITAASRAEVLELDRTTLLSLMQKYPRIGELIQRVFQARVESRE